MGCRPRAGKGAAALYWHDASIQTTRLSWSQALLNNQSRQLCKAPATQPCPGFCLDHTLHDTKAPSTYCDEGQRPCSLEARDRRGQATMTNVAGVSPESSASGKAAATAETTAPSSPRAVSKTNPSPVLPHPSAHQCTTPQNKAKHHIQQSRAEASARATNTSQPQPRLLPAPALLRPGRGRGDPSPCWSTKVGLLHASVRAASAGCRRLHCGSCHSKTKRLDASRHSATSVALSTACALQTSS